MGQVLGLVAKCIDNNNQQRQQPYQKGGGQSQVLFFPDGELPCRSMMKDGHCRFGDRCKYSHAETSLVQMLKVLRTSRRSLSICVFSITLDDIANTLLDLHRQGVQIRIFTDDDQSESQGSDIHRLAQAGIHCVMDNSHFHMHHKFAIIDKATLLNGSLNWTMQGVKSNQENVVITSDRALVSAFDTQFEKMWRQFSGNRVR